MTIFPTLNGLQKRGNLVGEGISEWVVKDMFTQYRLKRQGVYILCACVCYGHRLQLQRQAQQYVLQEHELHECFIKNYFKLSVCNESKLRRIISQLSGLTKKNSVTLLRLRLTCVTLRHTNTMLWTLIIIYILVKCPTNRNLRSQAWGSCSTGIRSIWRPGSRRSEQILVLEHV